ncbi:ABC transporter ATP-binding protein [Ensifer aridi]|uniref:ATP-binding cassette domain-containing protein n=1 Tax=Ensifer aridi TaxID=1708715 RepID=UPI000A116682|nr:ABC transporter ATP-binding protein [Ensifer aridi]
MTASSPLLDVANLSVTFRGSSGDTRVLDGVSLTVAQDIVGIVGESGSGKSTLARAVLGILPDNARLTADRLRLGEINLLALTSRDRAALLGRKMTMILQDPRYSLNPTMRVGDQVAEGLIRTAKMHRRAARDLTMSAFQAVRLRDPADLYNRYPHEISGGMGQRVMIAMMMVLGPQLLFADEMTSALDEDTKWAVLETLRELAAQRSMGLILISHDLDLVSSFCQRIIVMKDGRIEEDCRASDLAKSSNVYTRRLLAAGEWSSAVEMLR